MDNYDFRKYGMVVEALSQGLNVDAINPDTVDAYNRMDEEYKEDLTEIMHKKLASCLSNMFYAADPIEFAPEIFLFRKIASSDSKNWNSYYDDAMKTAISASLDSVENMQKTASALSQMASFLPLTAGDLTGYAIAAIPILGAMLAGSAYFAHKDINEDEEDTEKTKGKQVAYRILSGDVARRLRDKGYVVAPDELVGGLDPR